ncbi:polysaccharide deacetylase family protein [Clostridium gasigenes]|uniref:polysaccharide deacetylase family protein n=1 Tax=Clostridium gasigenes TaxID=94869 RepID=UPI001C0AABFE|nr:polysaccharide deacetylase family protein [Clostridium gasigenes]MBU3104177.1 polysaccharide deacetylase family protein [Clostridium gasigenes]MBU3107312.1 polysaccharide deacetylase family protein [Clostridium gasigenes]
MRKIYKCFPKGRFKALTMSYDDGIEQDKRLINIFNKYGIKGTFHLNSGRIDKDEQRDIDKYGGRVPKKQVVELYKGHEVAAHTATHPAIERCPITQVVNEIIEDRKELESILNYTVRGLSYPFGSYSDDIKKMLSFTGIEYSRIVGNSEKFDMPIDLYKWKPTCHHNHKLLEFTNDFISKDRNEYLYLFYVWGHSYEFDRDNNWNLIEEFSRKIGNRDDIWYATNIEIVDYLNAFNRLQFSMNGSFVYNPSVQSVWISVDNKIYEIKGDNQVWFS